jgi:AraC-like DNA-binding protein
MENYLYFQKSAQLLNNIPDVKKYVKSNDILQHLPYIKEFGKMEFHHVKLKSLELHYNDGIEILDIGQTSLNLLLKRETGFTPAQFLMDMRINEAKKQLQQSGQKITEIALNCGFCSLQHFSSTFLRITGYKPKEFRAGDHN